MDSDNNDPKSQESKLEFTLRLLKGKIQFLFYNLSLLNKC